MKSSKFAITSFVISFLIFVQAIIAFVDLPETHPLAPILFPIVLLIYLPEYPLGYLPQYLGFPVVLPVLSIIFLLISFRKEGRKILSITSIILIVISIALYLSLRFLPEQRPVNISTPQTNTETINWTTYRSQEYGFEIQYPTNWKLSEDNDFVGFRSPEWDKEPKLEGPTVTVSVLKGITKEEALLNSGFETKEEAVREKDEPLGGFGNEKYLARGSSAGPATPAKETTINGFSAIVAEIPTRLYGAEGYFGAGEGKQVFIMGHNIYANVRIQTSFYEIFDRMVSTFKFVQ